ncbi:hypothetical protein ACU79_15805 [Escherichia coli]|nr:hypothetical protein ACU79_15805 [Escherichia coli]
MIWQPEFTDKILSRKPGAVQVIEGVYVTESMADMLSRSDTSCQVDNISLNAIPNRTAEKQLHLDVTTLDAWPLDYHLQTV